MSGIQRLYKHESVEFTSVPNWVVRDPSYSPNAFRLLAYLLSHAQGYELTYQQIERQTTLGRYAINEAAKFLETTGWLELRRDKGPDGRWLAKTWIIKDPNSTANESTAGDSIVEPFHSGTANGHIEENLIKNKTNNRKTHLEGELEKFEEFWKEFPRKEGKKPAFKAFRSALTRAKFEDLLAGAIAYRSSDRVKRGFIKLPATWLNEDLWEDAASFIQGQTLNDDRRAKEKKHSEDYLRQMAEIEKQAAPAPKCQHGENIALCKKCQK